MKNPLVSIIIPVYNTEKYLEKCLDSIVNQIFKDIEIICINDGSTDNSLSILTKYADFDKRIKIINKKNEGQAKARNDGIEIASGEYITFVDSDDWIAENMLQDLYQIVSKENADIIICELELYNERSRKRYQLSWCKIPHNISNNYQNFKWNEISDSVFRFFTGPVAKLYKNDLIRNNNISFPKGLSYEDSPFVFDCLLKAERICVTRECFYTYRINRIDSTITSNGKTHFDIFQIIDRINQILNERPEYSVLFDQFDAYKVNDVIAAFLRLKSKFRKDFFCQMKIIFKKVNIKNNYIPFTNKILLFLIKNFKWFILKGMFFDNLLIFANYLKRNIFVKKKKSLVIECESALS